MDLDRAATELYSLPPEGFTARRTELEKQARADGDKDLARQIHALRRPTMAAWVSNLLVRERPDSARPLAELGQQLQEAQRTLEGTALRQLSRQRHQLIAALVLEARELALVAGHQVTEDVSRELEQTLGAALADPEAAEAVLSGRLSTALQHSGFGAALGRPAAPASSAGPDEVGAVRRRREDTAAARRREEVAAAERAVTAAVEEETQAADAATAAAAAVRAAADRRPDLEGEVARARQELAAAEHELSAVRREEAEAGRAHEQAARELARTQARTRNARDRLEELHRA